MTEENDKPKRRRRLYPRTPARRSSKKASPLPAEYPHVVSFAEVLGGHPEGEHSETTTGDAKVTPPAEGDSEEDSDEAGFHPPRD